MVRSGDSYVFKLFELCSLAVFQASCILCVVGRIFLFV